MDYSNWNEGVGVLGAELKHVEIQIKKNSLYIAQILQSSPDPLSHDHFCENSAYHNVNR